MEYSPNQALAADRKKPRPLKINVMKKEQNTTMIFLNWNQLKFLPNNRLIKSMGYWLFIVPIAVKLLSLIENPVLIKFDDYLLKLDFSLPFSWYAFFFSALFFSVGNVFYMFWCPSVVKDHLAFAGFLNDGKTIDHLEFYSEEILIDFENLKQELKYDSTASPTLELKKLFWYIFKKSKTCRPVRRLLCVGSYYIGFGFAIYVVFSNVVWVINEFYS